LIKKFHRTCANNRTCVDLKIASDSKTAEDIEIKKFFALKTENNLNWKTHTEYIPHQGLHALPWGQLHRAQKQKA
jgi:hypothetical protein